MLWKNGLRKGNHPRAYRFFFWFSDIRRLTIYAHPCYALFHIARDAGLGCCITPLFGQCFRATEAWLHVSGVAYMRRERPVQYFLNIYSDMWYVCTVPYPGPGWYRPGKQSEPETVAGKGAKGDKKELAMVSPCNIVLNQKKSVCIKRTRRSLEVMCQIRGVIASILCAKQAFQPCMWRAMV